MTPDPYQASAGAGDPGSWNRYSYVQGDPVNFFDPEGLAAKPACVDGTGDNGNDASGNTPCVTVVYTPPVNVTAKAPGVDWTWVNQVVAGWTMTQKAANARIDNFDWEEYERKEREKQLQECNKQVRAKASEAYGSYKTQLQAEWLEDLGKGIAIGAGAGLYNTGTWQGAVVGGLYGMVNAAIIEGLYKFAVKESTYVFTVYKPALESGASECDRKYRP